MIRKYAPLLVALGLPMAAVAAAPVTMTCTGSRNSPDPATGAFATHDVTFQLRIDAEARQVAQDGQTMVIRAWSDRQIVYSDYNPGILSAVAGGVVTTFNRTTGTWRDKWGGGACKLAQGKTAG